MITNPINIALKAHLLIKENPKTEVIMPVNNDNGKKIMAIM